MINPLLSLIGALSVLIPEMTQRKIAFSASSHLSIKMLPENIIKSIC